MTELTRREVLAGAAAAAAVVAVGAPTAAAVEAAATLPTRPPLPSWAVGTPGEQDWQVIDGLTEHDAKVRWLGDWGSFEESHCEIGSEIGRAECNCEACCAYRDLDLRRQPDWDGKEVTNAMWFDAGFDAPCSRCGEPAGRQSDGDIVNDKVVCCDCMTLADFEIVDPEHAAEIRENASC